MRPSRSVATPIVLCALVALALVGTPAKHAFAKDAFAKDKAGIAIAENMEMQDFLNALARTTGVPLVWNPADKNIRGRVLKGGITLKGSPDEVFSLARGLLTFYELVIIPIGPSGNRVQLIADARQTSAILKLKPQSVVLTEANLAHYEAADGLFITTSIHVEHMDDLRNARNALTRIVTGQNIGNVTEVPNAKAFVVTDFAPNVVAIYRLLKRMDVPRKKLSTASGETVAVTLEHARAEELAEVLNGHYAVVAPRGGARRPQAPAPTTTSAPRITADGRTNQLLVTGDEAEIKQVRAAIALLDVPVIVTSVAAHVVRLKHIETNVAAEVLSRLVDTSPNLFERGPAGPSIVAHDETSSLLVSASKRDFETIQRLVAELDVERK